MVIVVIKCGLGNQMFQYALYKSLLDNKKEVKLDISWFKTNQDHNGLELEKVFEIGPFDIASKRELNLLREYKKDLFSKFKRKIFGFKKKHYTEKKMNFKYNKKIFQKDNIYLDGFWQSENYFYNIKEDIFDIFKFRKIIGKRNIDLAETISNSESVSVHIRRGDYLQDENLGGVCNNSYYLESVKILQTKLKNPFFYFFSDDPDWVKKTFNLDRMKVIDWNTGINSYLDMFLMTKCKHNVIANSSFSWWGAYLNNYKNKIVIAPKVWFNDNLHKDNDIVPKKWLKI